jgi:hypothetical protein
MRKKLKELIDAEKNKAAKAAEKEQLFHVNRDAYRCRFVEWADKVIKPAMDDIAKSLRDSEREILVEEEVDGLRMYVGEPMASTIDPEVTDFIQFSAGPKLEKVSVTERNASSYPRSRHFEVWLADLSPENVNQILFDFVKRCIGS